MPEFALPRKERAREAWETGNKGHSWEKVEGTGKVQWRKCAHGVKECGIRMLVCAGQGT